MVWELVALGFVCQKIYKAPTTTQSSPSSLALAALKQNSVPTHHWDFTFTPCMTALSTFNSTSLIHQPPYMLPSILIYPLLFFIFSLPILIIYFCAIVWWQSSSKLSCLFWASDPLFVQSRIHEYLPETLVCFCKIINFNKREEFFLVHDVHI